MISATRADIADMAATIVRPVAPERIVLFGSQARGEATLGSDVDLLVVTQFTGPRAIRPSRSVELSGAGEWRRTSSWSPPTRLDGTHRFPVR
ncbi:MAG: nucleotidyltransferase domain-containing protein [Armatimonadetes bacterium]|nr:nucleotidyltransferase domain-containing protein [Armatimonadota bacterium]